MGFSECQHIEEVRGRRGVDVPGVFLATMIEDDYRRQPDDIQVTHMPVGHVNAQRNERLRHNRDDLWVWIHHGIQ